MSLLKTFSRRIGRSLSIQKKDLLNDLLPKLTFSEEKVFSISKEKEIVLEIGFGMGDHLIHQLEIFPERFFIGAEVYIPGVANVLNFVNSTNKNNLLLWPDNIDLIINSIPDASLTEIFILFPDPWPKKRQQKKRLVNKERLDLFIKKLKNNGNIIFGSDINDYVKKVQNLIMESEKLSLTKTDYLQNYIPTKYHNLAILENRQASFLIATKK